MWWRVGMLGEMIKGKQEYKITEGLGHGIRKQKFIRWNLALENNGTRMYRGEGRDSKARS